MVVGYTSQTLKKTRQILIRQWLPCHAAGHDAQPTRIGTNHVHVPDSFAGARADSGVMLTKDEK